MADDANSDAKKETKKREASEAAVIPKRQKVEMYRSARIQPPFALEAETLLVASFGEQKKRTKLAAFDFDGTLCKHMFGKMLTDSVYPNAADVLKKFAAQGYALAILTNESIDHLKNPPAIEKAMTKKIQRLTTWITNAGVDVLVLMAVSKKNGDFHKSKGSGMWRRATSDLLLPDTDSSTSFFVGDSGDDENLAKLANVSYYHVDAFFSSQYKKLLASS